jgi:hypothetical protein
VYSIHVTIVERAGQKLGGFNLQNKQYLNIISNTMRSLQNDWRVLKQNLFSLHSKTRVRLALSVTYKIGSGT